MKISRLWAYIRRRALTFMVTVVVGWSVVIPADAQTVVDAAVNELPSSVHPPQDRWENMVESSFRGTVKDALRQCYRNADVSADDALTPLKCALLGEMLTAGECSVVQVPDGVVFDILNGLLAGESHMWFLMEKQLGRLDRALLCDVGNGVHAYWFTGIVGQSCNNLAFAMLPPPPAEEPEPEGRMVCRQVPFNDPVRTSFYQHNDSVYQKGCCCGDFYVPSSHFYMGDTLQSSGHTEECWWVPYSRKQEE